MSLTFPRPFPGGVSAEYFEPERVDYQTPVVDGRVTGVTAGFPLWRARWTLGRSISRQMSDQWRTLVAVLRGGQRTFFAGDSEHSMPQHYPDGFGGMTRPGGGAFDGSTTSWSVNTDRDVVTLNLQPVGLQLAEVDYCMWRWTTGGQQRRALVRLVEPATANGSGVISFTCEPPLPSLVPGSAVADLVNPQCIMKLITGETKLGDRDRSGKISGTVAAIQDLRA